MNRGLNIPDGSAVFVIALFFHSSASYIPSVQTQVADDITNARWPFCPVGKHDKLSSKLD